MGWTETYKPKGQNLTEFFIEHGTLRWTDSPCTYRVLDAALVNLTEYYAAVEQVHNTTGERKVWCAVFLIRHLRRARFGYNDYNFAYKDMDESCGPVVSNCPERILDLLTETEHEYAKEWRARCREKIRVRSEKPALVPGTVLLADPPISFRDGSLISKLTLKSRRGSRFSFVNPEGYGNYWLTLQWINNALTDKRVSFAPAT